MKKILVLPLLLFIVSTFVGCESDYVYVSTYVYRNKSSWDITVKSYSHNFDRDSIFVISKDNAHTLKCGEEGDFPDPFILFHNTSPNDYTIFSNGEKQFVNTRWSDSGGDRLYLKENYTIVSDKNRLRTYQYIFTDEDFANAAPIEP